MSVMGGTHTVMGSVNLAGWRLAEGLRRLREVVGPGLGQRQSRFGGGVHQEGLQTTAL